MKGQGGFVVNFERSFGRSISSTTQFDLCHCDYHENLKAMICSLKESHAQLHNDVIGCNFQRVYEMSLSEIHIKIITA